jgi:outer membrane receptor protein involved in Fe transport
MQTSIQGHVRRLARSIARAVAPGRGLAVLAGLALSAPAAAQPGASPPVSTEPTVPGSIAPPADTRVAPALSSEAPASSTTAAAISVRGRVIDALGKPVAGAHVSATEREAETTTDRAGKFRIAAPVGATLMVERDGYDVALASVTGGELDDVVVLAAGTSAETIEIEGELPAASPGAAKLDRSELQRIPGGGGDVVRTLTAMPGVVNQQIPLGYNGIAIRGSSPQDSKVMIDGFEVPVLFHNIGFRAVVPAEAIESLDYIPGGFDVSLGRASSGIVNLTTRPGGTGHTSEAEISLLDGGLLAQGAAGADTHYMFGLRRSTIDLLAPSLFSIGPDLSLTTVPRYYDGQLRIDHELSASWHLTLSAIGSDDLFEVGASSAPDAAAKRLYDRVRWARGTVSAQYHDGPWSANLAVSELVPQFDAMNGVDQHIKYSYPMTTPRGEITRTAAAAAGLTDVTWRVGAEAQVTRADIDIAVGQERREGEPPPAMNPRDTTMTFKGVIWMPDAAAWTTLGANAGPWLRVTAGLRSDYYGRAGELALQPRGELQIKLPSALTARLSAGMFSRPPEFQSEVLTKGLRSERSTQGIAGLQYEPRAGMRLQTSLYYTDRSQLITQAADGALGNDGRGTTAGAELLATYRGDTWLAWLSYAYSHSIRVDHPGMASRLFDYDQPHSLNAAASWKHGRWQLGGRFQLYSGLPYTPVTGAVLDSDHNVYMPTYGAVNSERAPIHHQLDVRIDYSWAWGPAALTAFLDVQNVYMNESVITYLYSYDYSQRAAFKSLPLLPSLGLRGVL